MSRAVLAVLVVALAVAPARADDAADEARFGAATVKLGAGDLAGARTDLEALAAASPDGRWADDALAEAAAIAERQGDLAGARALWKRLIDAYPDGSPARRAAPRLAALQAASGPDGRWDAVAAAHRRIEQVVASAEDPTAALTELGGLLDEHPGYPRWFAAALWLGERWADLGARGPAERWIERAGTAARDDQERFRAGLARGDLLAAGGRFAAAERAYRGLRPPDRLAADAVADALDELAFARLRWRLGRAARIALGACALLALLAIRRRAGSWRGALAALWPPPIEAIYLAPVALVLGVIAGTGNPMAAHAAQTILAGAVAITWLAGAALTAARRRGPVGAGALATHIVVVLIATVALCYAAVADDQLLELLLETWRRGHER